MDHLSSLANLLSSTDASVQAGTRKLIEEIVLSVIKSRESSPEILREKMLIRRVQELVTESHKNSVENQERLAKFDVVMKKRIKDCEERVAELAKKVATLGVQINENHDTTTREMNKLYQLREEFNSSISKERNQRLKLFTRWSDTHGSDLDRLSEKMNRELTFLAQRSKKEFVEQSEYLEQIKDKLDYALLKRYGYIPDTKRIVEDGYNTMDEIEHAGDKTYPRFRGNFNLAADASQIVLGLDNRIDSLSGKVQDLSRQATLTKQVQEWGVRRLHTRNQSSDDGSGSAEDYGFGSSDDSHEQETSTTSSIVPLDKKFGRRNENCGGGSGPVESSVSNRFHGNGRNGKGSGRGVFRRAIKN